MEHNEFVVQFKNGGRDWVDPVSEIWEDDYIIYVNNHSFTYEFVKTDIDKWAVRPYSSETTYDPIEEN